VIEGVTQQAPSTDGIDWQNGDQVMQYQLSQNEWIRSMVDKIASRANEPKYITMPDGRSLADIAKGQPWSGVVWLLDTTLSEAYRQCAKNGFRVMDGSNGTQDMRDQFVRGASANSGSGETGGAAYFCTSAFGISDHPAHNHNACTGGPSACSCRFLVCPGGSDAASNSHTHSVTVSNNTAQSHTIPDVDIDIIPPYYTMIFARKV